jgi:integrase
VNQYTIQTPHLAIRRPQQETRYKEQIDKTIAKATIEGKANNTLKSFRHRLAQLSKVADLMNPDDVKKAIAYAKLANSSKCSFALAYEWFTKANGIQWEKPRFKWNQGTPIIPTTDQVNKIISATTLRFATMFKLMAETGVEGEELHQTHRNQFETTQGIISIKGLKGHGSANYKLKAPIANMLREYLAKDPKEYPFPRPYIMSTMWRRARETASKNHNDPSLKTIPMKNLRNYSGAQFYYQFPDPIGVMRHLRHKRIETTMHYIRAITLDGDVEYDCKTAKTPEEITKLIELGYAKADEIDGIHFYRKRK